MPTTPIWLLPFWSRTIERNRFCTQAFVVGPAAAALSAAGHGMLGLLVFCVGSWPLPYRARWTADGLDVSWLFLRERLHVTDIAYARLRTDFRRWRLIRYPLVLELGLAGGRRAVAVGSTGTLQGLHADITAALPRRAETSSAPIVG